MKYLYFIPFIFLCLPVFAQENKEQCNGKGFFDKNSILITAGVGASSFYDSKENDNTFQVFSFNVRVLVERLIYHQWALAYGMQFSNGGTSGQIEERYKHLFARKKYYYAGIPIMAKWHEKKDKGFVLSVGFVPDFLVAAKETYKDFDIEQSKSIMDLSNKVDCKFTFDAAYTFNNNIMIGLIMERGLCSVGNTEFVFNKDATFRNASVYFYAGYRFHKKQHKR